MIVRFFFIILFLFWDTPSWAKSMASLPTHEWMNGENQNVDGLSIKSLFLAINLQNSCAKNCLDWTRRENYLKKFDHFNLVVLTISGNETVHFQLEEIKGHAIPKLNSEFEGKLKRAFKIEKNKFFLNSGTNDRKNICQLEIVFDVFSTSANYIIPWSVGAVIYVPDFPNEHEIYVWQFNMVQILPKTDAISDKKWRVMDFLLEKFAEDWGKANGFK